MVKKYYGKRKFNTGKAQAISKKRWKKKINYFNFMGKGKVMQKITMTANVWVKFTSADAGHFSFERATLNRQTELNWYNTNEYYEMRSQYAFACVSGAAVTFRRTGTLYNSSDSTAGWNIDSIPPISLTIAPHVDTTIQATQLPEYDYRSNTALIIQVLNNDSAPISRYYAFPHSMVGMDGNTIGGSKTWMATTQNVNPPNISHLDLRLGYSDGMFRSYLSGLAVYPLDRLVGVVNVDFYVRFACPLNLRVNPPAPPA